MKAFYRRAVPIWHLFIIPPWSTLLLSFFHWLHLLSLHSLEKGTYFVNVYVCLWWQWLPIQFRFFAVLYEVQNVWQKMPQLFFIIFLKLWWSGKQYSFPLVWKQLLDLTDHPYSVSLPWELILWWAQLDIVTCRSVEILALLSDTPVRAKKFE